MSAANGTRTDAPDATLAAKAAFVEHFRTGWVGGADTLVELLLPDLLDPDVVAARACAALTGGYAVVGALHVARETAGYGSGAPRGTRRRPERR
jgi:hypothetical protein